MGTKAARRNALALSAIVLALAPFALTAPVSESTEMEVYEESGCYYNFQHYGEGDRIMTNEPCLNCTCHNRMLMCYLRVCPFTKAIGQDCTVEKRGDQCCPIITCPDVPVDLMAATTSSPDDLTEIGHRDIYGCTINNKFYSDGAKVPSSLDKPCELCYCIRNMTTCVMQECTLHVEGCTPVYHKGVCCPVRYSCDHPIEEGLLLDDMTTTVRPTPGFILTTTESMTTGYTMECTYNDETYADGALIKTSKACEHCYCMKGEIVCVVQECGTPMENKGKNCTADPPREGQCCPDIYVCSEDTITTVISDVTEPSVDEKEHVPIHAQETTLGTDQEEETVHTTKSYETEGDVTVPEHVSHVTQIRDNKGEDQTIDTEEGKPDLQMSTQLPPVKDDTEITAEDSQSTEKHLHEISTMKSDKQDTSDLDKEYIPTSPDDKGHEDSDFVTESYGSGSGDHVIHFDDHVKEEDDTKHTSQPTIHTDLTPIDEGEQDGISTKKEDASHYTDKPLTSYFAEEEKTKLDTEEESGEKYVTKGPTEPPLDEEHKILSDHKEVKATEKPLESISSEEHDVTSSEEDIHQEKEEFATETVIPERKETEKPHYDESITEKYSTPSDEEHDITTDQEKISDEQKTDKPISSVDDASSHDEEQHTTHKQGDTSIDHITEKSFTTVSVHELDQTKPHDEKDILTDVTHPSDEEKPTDEEKESTHDEEKPTDEEKESTHDEEKPTDEEKESTHDEEKPTDEEKESTHDEEKHITDAPHTTLSDEHLSKDTEMTTIDHKLDEKVTKYEPDETSTSSIDFTTKEHKVPETETSDKHAEDSEHDLTTETYKEKDETIVPTTDRGLLHGVKDITEEPYILRTKPHISTEKPEDESESITSEKVDDEYQHTTIHDHVTSFDDESQVHTTKTPLESDVKVDEDIGQRKGVTEPSEYEPTSHMTEKVTTLDHKVLEDDDEDEKITKTQSTTIKLPDSDLQHTTDAFDIEKVTTIKAVATDDELTTVKDMLEKTTEHLDWIEDNTQQPQKPSETSDLYPPEVDLHKPDDNVTPTEELPRIPGEGNCLIDGISYKNNSKVPSMNKCLASCECMNSLLKCEHIHCSPPPSNMINCQPVQHSKDACCPTYVCEQDEKTAIESGSQMHDIHDETDQTSEVYPDKISTKLDHTEPIPTTLEGDIFTHKPTQHEDVHHAETKAPISLHDSTSTAKPEDDEASEIPIVPIVYLPDCGTDGCFKDSTKPGQEISTTTDEIDQFSQAVFQTTNIFDDKSDRTTPGVPMFSEKITKHAGTEEASTIMSPTHIKEQDIEHHETTIMPPRDEIFTTKYPEDVHIADITTIKTDQRILDGEMVEQDVIKTTSSEGLHVDSTDLNIIDGDIHQKHEDDSTTPHEEDKDEIKTQTAQQEEISDTEKTTEIHAYVDDKKETDELTTHAEPSPERHTEYTTMHPNFTTPVERQPERHTKYTTMHPDFTTPIEPQTERHTKYTTMHPDFTTPVEQQPEQHTEYTTMHPDFTTAIEQQPEHPKFTTVHPDKLDKQPTKAAKDEYDTQVEDKLTTKGHVVSPDEDTETTQKTIIDEEGSTEIDDSPTTLRPYKVAVDDEKISTKKEETISTVDHMTDYTTHHPQQEFVEHTSHKEITTKMPELEITTSYSDDINEIGVSVQPVDIVDEECSSPGCSTKKVEEKKPSGETPDEKPITSADCGELGCVVQAEYHKPTTVKSDILDECTGENCQTETKTSKAPESLPECGENGCSEDDRINVIVDEDEKLDCKSKDCETEAKPDTSIKTDAECSDAKCLQETSAEEPKVTTALPGEVHTDKVPIQDQVTDLPHKTIPTDVKDTGIDNEIDTEQSNIKCSGEDCVSITEKPSGIEIKPDCLSNDCNELLKPTEKVDSSEITTEVNKLTTDDLTKLNEVFDDQQAEHQTDLDDIFKPVETTITPESHHTTKDESHEVPHGVVCIDDRCAFAPETSEEVLPTEISKDADKSTTEKIIGESIKDESHEDDSGISEYTTEITTHKDSIDKQKYDETHTTEKTTDKEEMKTTTIQSKEKPSSTDVYATDKPVDILGDEKTTFASVDTTETPFKFGSTEEKDVDKDEIQTTLSPSYTESKVTHPTIDESDLIGKTTDVSKVHEDVTEFVTEKQPEQTDDYQEHEDKHKISTTKKDEEESTIKIDELQRTTSYPTVSKDYDQSTTNILEKDELDKSTTIKSEEDELLSTTHHMEHKPTEDKESHKDEISTEGHIKIDTRDEGITEKPIDEPSEENIEDQEILTMKTTKIPVIVTEDRVTDKIEDEVSITDSPLKHTTVVEIHKETHTDASVTLPETVITEKLTTVVEQVTEDTHFISEKETEKAPMESVDQIKELAGRPETTSKPSAEGQEVGEVTKFEDEIKTSKPTSHLDDHVTEVFKEATEKGISERTTLPSVISEDTTFTTTEKLTEDEKKTHVTPEKVDVLDEKDLSPTEKATTPLDEYVTVKAGLLDDIVTEDDTKTHTEDQHLSTKIHEMETEKPLKVIHDDELDQLSTKYPETYETISEEEKTVKPDVEKLPEDIDEKDIQQTTEQLETHEDKHKTEAPVSELDKEITHVTKDILETTTIKIAEVVTEIFETTPQQEYQQPTEIKHHEDQEHESSTETVHSQTIKDEFDEISTDGHAPDVLQSTEKPNVLEERGTTHPPQTIQDTEKEVAEGHEPSTSVKSPSDDKLTQETDYEITTTHYVKPDDTKDIDVTESSTHYPEIHTTKISDEVHREKDELTEKYDTDHTTKQPEDTITKVHGDKIDELQYSETTPGILEGTEADKDSSDVEIEKDSQHHITTSTEKISDITAEKDEMDVTTLKAHHIDEPVSLGEEHSTTPEHIPVHAGEHTTLPESDGVTSAPKESTIHTFTSTESLLTTLMQELDKKQAESEESEGETLGHEVEKSTSSSVEDRYATTVTEDKVSTEVSQDVHEKPQNEFDDDTKPEQEQDSSEDSIPASDKPTIESEERITTIATQAISEEHITTTPLVDHTTEIPITQASSSTTGIPSDEDVQKPQHPHYEDEDEIPHAPQLPDFPAGYGSSGTEDQDYGEEDQSFGPGTCRYGGKVYVSAQQIPRDDPCDFCFCFRSDIICLQQSCPPPIQRCHEEPIQGFCCPRYECPVSMATVLNVTTTTTTTTTTLPPHFLSHAYKGAARRQGCQIQGKSYRVGEVVRSASGPCLHCKCGGDGQMKCDPKVCTPEPMLRQMIAAVATTRRR